jgi:hypothetical protein
VEKLIVPMHILIQRVGTKMFEGMNQNQIPFEPAEWFPELDALQKSGQMNMFGAPRWLQEQFDFSKEQSMVIFNAWVDYKEGK